MKLNKSTGNMYEFITHTGNIIKGKCPHNCSYCYMKKWGERHSPIHLDESELRTNTQCGNFIFVGSSGDMFADTIPKEYIWTTLNHCYESNNNMFEEGNKYFFQSKNPRRFLEFIHHPIFNDSVICTTIETNRWYQEYMGNCPRVEDRVSAMEEISKRGYRTYVTAEPLMDFDLEEMIESIRRCNPIQFTIGRNTYKEVSLPEPNNNKVENLTIEVSKFTEVLIKKNALEDSSKDIKVAYDKEQNELVEV